MQKTVVDCSTGESQVVDLTQTEIDALQPTIQQSQQTKITQLQADLITTLESGFNSSATGTSYLYGFSDTGPFSDQKNLGQELAIVNAGKAIEPIEWGIKSGQVVNHTIAQFVEVCADGNRFKWAQVNQLRSLVGQVNTATTVEAVQAVVWTPATY